MNTSRFEYVMYLSAPPEKIWAALIEPGTTAKYWQHVNVSDWKPGSRWEHRGVGEKGDPLLVGKVVEFTPPKRLVLTWALPADEAREDRHSRLTIRIEPFRDVARLTLVHDRLEAGTAMLRDIAEGWPKVLSSLKSLLETGRALPDLW